MNKAWRMLTTGSQMVASVCAATALFGIMLLMLADVIGRYLFNAPVPGAAEVIELAMGVTVFAALPLVTAKCEHVRLDYLSRAVRGRVQALAEAVVVSISVLVMALLAWRLALKAATVWRYGDSTAFLNIPVAPIAGFISACALACTLIFLWQGLCAWRQVFGGN